MCTADVLSQVDSKLFDACGPQRQR